jgi:hypothetical protein
MLVQISGELTCTADNDLYFLQNIITGDET